MKLLHCRRRREPTAGEVRFDTTLCHPLARRFRAAVGQGDVATAVDAYAEAATGDDRALLIRAAATLGHLPADITQRDHPPTSPLALLTSAHAVVWAGAHEAGEALHAHLRTVEADLRSIAAGSADDPVVWEWLLITGRWLGRGIHELRARFEEGRLRDPDLESLHAAHLQGVCAKWRGNHETMFDFARQTSAAATAGSPLHHLVADAHLEFAVGLGDEGFVRYLRGPARDEVETAAARSVLHHDFPTSGGHAGRIAALNSFAAASLAMGDYHVVHALLDRLDGCYTEYPWYLLEGDAALAITEARRVADLHGAPALPTR